MITLFIVLYRNVTAIKDIIIIPSKEIPLWLLCSSRVYSVRPLQLAGHFDVLDGSNGSCGQGNGGWTNQVNFWAIFFQMENLMGNWCKILAKLC